MCPGCDLVRACVCVCVLQVKPKAQQSSVLLAPKKGNGDWVMKTPERRRFCLRQGLAQRYWFSENVGKLPFKSKALAASVGSARLAPARPAPRLHRVIASPAAQNHHSIARRRAPQFTTKPCARTSRNIAQRDAADQTPISDGRARPLRISEQSSEQTRGGSRDRR